MRKQRQQNEQDRVDYNFVGEAQFVQRIPDGALLQHVVMYIIIALSRAYNCL